MTLGVIRVRSFSVHLCVRRPGKWYRRSGKRLWNPVTVLIYSKQGRKFPRV